MQANKKQIRTFLPLQAHNVRDLLGLPITAAANSHDRKKNQCGSRSRAKLRDSNHVTSGVLTGTCDIVC